MMKISRNNYLCGLDIGTSKVCAVIGREMSKAEKNSDGQTLAHYPEPLCRIEGIGIVSSKGLKEGKITDLARLSSSIREAVEKAESIAGVRPRSAIVNISREDLSASYSSAAALIRRESRGVQQKDVRKVIDLAKSLAAPLEREIISAVPYSFRIDRQNNLKDPLGLVGRKLEADIYVVTAKTGTKDNLIKAVHCAGAGLDVLQVLLSAEALSESILTRKRRDMGVVVIDIGGGTTEISIFKEGKLRYIDILAIGADAITEEISYSLKIPRNKANALKERYSQHFNTHPQLQLILQRNIGKLFNCINASLHKSRLKDSIEEGMIITGGMALMEGLLEKAEELFKMPVRLGLPRNIICKTSLTPAESLNCAVAIGLLKQGIRIQSRPKLFLKKKSKNLFQNTIRHLKDLYYEYF